CAINYGYYFDYW
nr:immunoglobulin heavy chain junction region [Mus musculus]MBK4184391.1 immunoglobulin heavy chain junction region [Mus musculus]